MQDIFSQYTFLRQYSGAGTYTYFSGTTLPGSRHNVLHWETTVNIPWYLNQSGAGDGLTYDQTKDAIATACNTWRDVSTAYIEFNYVGSTPNKHNNSDGKNVIFWAENGDQGFVTGYYGTIMTSAYLALTIITINENQEILDVDIAFNGKDQTWKTEPFHDIQSVATHEIGHLLGIGHFYGFANPVPTMSEALMTEPGARTLEQQDIDPVTFLYKQTVNVPSDFSSLSDALNDAVPNSNQTIIVNGTTNLGSDALVLSGVTLTIQSGSIVNLNGHSITSSGGNIINNGATINGLKATLSANSVLKGLYPTIQAACSNAGSNYSVNIQPGNISENVSVSNKSGLTVSAPQDQTYITGTMTFYNCPSLYLSNFECTNLSISNSSYTTLYNNTYGTGTSGTHGIQVSSCSDFQRRGYSENSNIGLLAISSTGDIYSNAYFTNNYIGIKSTSSSNIAVLGSPICGSVYKDLYADVSGYLYAENCYYNNGTARYYEALEGDVVISGQYNCSSLGKSNSDSKDGNSISINEKIQSEDQVINDFISINNSYFNLSNKIRDDIKGKGSFDKEKFRKEHSDIINNFRNFIMKNPDISLSRTALVTSALSFVSFEENESLKQFLDEIIANKQLGKLKGLAERFMLDYYRNNKDFNSAVAKAHNIINTYTDDEELLCSTIYEKGLIELYDLNKKEIAEESFKSIIKNYPKSDIASFAKTQLRAIGYSIEEDEKETTIVDKSKLSITNHPNPFNPTTTIKYNIPQEGMVTIRIYDILGREVAKLVDEFKPAGSYNVLWNGKDGSGTEVSSGVYFYNIRYNDNTITKKMMLVR